MVVIIVILNKIELRDKIKEKILDDKYVDAAILYGVYKAIGGRKIYPMPLYTVQITSVIYNISLIKTKAGRTSIDKLGIIIKELSEQLDMGDYRYFLNNEEVTIEMDNLQWKSQLRNDKIYDIYYIIAIYNMKKLGINNVNCGSEELIKKLFREDWDR